MFVDSNLLNYEGHMLTGVRFTLAAAVAPNEPAGREQSRHGSSSTRLQETFASVVWKDGMMPSEASKGTRM